MVSPRKSTSALSLIPEEHCKMMASATKSCESLYSNSSIGSKGSASILYRRQTPPNRGINRQATLISATNEVRQRVLSARRLRMKTYQNQLADAQQTIADLAHENRILRTLHKRQDSALAKYESTNAELPQLLHSHAEELRVWQTKYRNLQTLSKELEHRLKQKEAIIISLNDQNKYYSQLNKDKNLDERQRLTEKLLTLETRLQERESDMKLLARKVQLEAKNYKQQLQGEQKKTKEVMLKLEKARIEMSGYRKLEELSLTDNFSKASLRRIPNVNKETKLDKDLDKVMDKPEYNNETAEDTDYQTSARSNNISKLEMCSTRTIRKLNAVPSRDAPTMGSFKNASVRLQENELIRQASKSVEYPDDYENGAEESAANSDVDAENDVAEDGNDGEAAQDEEAEPEAVDEGDDDEEDVIINTAKSSARMKEEITSIRKQISDDYKEREAFLDTFCRQATSNVNDDTSKKRNSIALVGHNIPSSRKHKLLAALKAIDDNKSQD